MKTAEEINALKTEVEALNKKLAELTDDELMQITGGKEYTIPIPTDEEFWRSWNPNALSENAD